MHGPKAGTPIVDIPVDMFSGSTNSRWMICAAQPRRKAWRNHQAGIDRSGSRGIKAAAEKKTRTNFLRSWI
jgi:hypothetical protein